MKVTVLEKFNLTDRREQNGKVIEIYDEGCYLIKVIRREDSDYLRVEIRKNSDSYYLPEIYTRYSYDTNEIECFEVQTTSYGALNYTEIQKMIVVFEEAYKLVLYLTDKFISKEGDKSVE